MKRRDFLGALGGSFALSRSEFSPQTKAQGSNNTRSIHETAAERLLELYSYIPDTLQYGELAIGDALWSDIAKQFDAFGYEDARADYFTGEVSGQFGWLTTGPDITGDWSQPGYFSFVPQLAADQILQLGALDNPITLTLYTGIDPDVPLAKFKEKAYSRSLFDGGTLFTHNEVDQLRDITWNRFAVLLDEGVLAWFEAQELAEEYVAWRESGGTSLSDNERVRETLEFAESDAITCAWVDGSRFNLDGSVRRVLGDYTATETIEAYRQQLMPTFTEQEELFGTMPPLKTMVIGSDAGASPVPESVVSGYEVPEAHVRLQLGSESAVYLAAAIILWRMDNSPSFVTREIIDFEPYDMLSFDFSAADKGILIQRFGNPVATQRLLSMIRQYDPAIYGWGILG